MKKIVIASACRTAIGKFGGTLANVPAVELGSIVIKEALNRANVKPEQVDHVYMGCVIQAGLRQMCSLSASRINSSRKSGCATLIRASAFSQEVRPFRFTQPYSVHR